MNIFKKALIVALSVGLISVPTVTKEVEAAAPSTLYLTPNSNWKQSNARFAAYFFGNGEKWVSMTDSDKDSVYEVSVPSGYPSVIFCRMNPSASANNWSNKWNQTANLSIPTNGTNHYTVKDGTWDKGGGTWSTFGSDTPAEPEPETPDSYSLIGTFNGWDITNEDYEMTPNGDKTVYTYSNLSVETTAEFKVVKDHSWAEAYPGSNYVIDTPGIYDVTFTVSSKTVGVELKETLEIPEANTEWYLRGDHNDWSTNAESLLSAVDGQQYTYSITVDLGANVEFKIANSDWTRQFNLTNLSSNSLTYVSDAKDDNKIITNAEGTYTMTISFDYDTTNGKYSNEKLDITFIEKLEPEVFTELETLYFTASHWDVDGAWFAAYFYNRADDYQWVKASKLYSSIYSIDVPDGEWSKVIFCRMNNEFDTMEWNSVDEEAPKHVWNQTANIGFDGENDYFTVTDGLWNDATGTWSKFNAPYATFDVVTAELGFNYTYDSETNELVEVTSASLRFATPKLLASDFEVDSYGMIISFGDSTKEFTWNQNELVVDGENVSWSAVVLNIPETYFKTTISITCFVTIGTDKVVVSNTREVTIAGLAETYLNEHVSELNDVEKAGCQYIIGMVAA